VPFSNIYSTAPQGSLIFSNFLASSVSRPDDIDRFTVALEVDPRSWTGGGAALKRACWEKDGSLVCVN